MVLLVNLMVFLMLLVSIIMGNLEKVSSLVLSLWVMGCTFC